MAYNLTEYITQILLQLGDPAQTYHSTASVTEALRNSLIEYSRLAPIERTYVIDSTGDKRITLPADFEASHLIKAEYELNTTTYDAESEIFFYATKQDEQWVIETNEAIATGQVITITYAIKHGIDALDSFAGTTILPHHEQYLIQGAAGYTLLNRASGRVEPINLNSGIVDSYRQQAAVFLQNFRAGVRSTSTAIRTQPTYTEPTGF